MTCREDRSSLGGIKGSCDFETSQTRSATWTSLQPQIDQIWGRAEIEPAAGLKTEVAAIGTGGAARE